MVPRRARDLLPRAPWSASGRGWWPGSLAGSGCGCGRPFQAAWAPILSRCSLETDKAPPASGVVRARTLLRERTNHPGSMCRSHPNTMTSEMWREVLSSAVSGLRIPTGISKHQLLARTEYFEPEFCVSVAGSCCLHGDMSFPRFLPATNELGRLASHLRVNECRILKPRLPGAA